MHTFSAAWTELGLGLVLNQHPCRRGHQVYSQVCAACHSVQALHYRNLVGVAYTEEEMKAAAAEVRTGPCQLLCWVLGPTASRLPQPQPLASQNMWQARAC